LEHKQQERRVKVQRAEIVQSGYWLYDNSVQYEVWVVKQNWDSYYDPGFEDEPERLNANGELYRILIAKAGEVVGSVSDCRMSLEDATSIAEARLTKITWDNHRIQQLFGGHLYKVSN
jgi:hypothetical protein